MHGFVLVALGYLLLRAQAPRLEAASPKVMHTEADRLVTAGLVREARRGRARLLRAETSGPVSRPLTDLLAVTYGPLPVLADLLSEVAGVDQAFIYGSWAARYLGEPGPVPQDVDVLAVGTASDDDLYDIRAHVLICWLALLLTRVAERSCDQSWRNIRRETARLKQVTLTGQAGTITQTTPLRPEQKAIYQALSITPPPRITAFDPA